MSNFKNFQLDYVLWEVTQKCNLRCIHCRAGAYPELVEEKIIEGKGIGEVAKAKRKELGRKIDQ